MAYTHNVWLQANWFKAEQYCRFHGMHLASINSAEEQRELGDHIQSFGESIKKVRQNIGFLISCSLTFQPIISISQCNVFLQWQHGHWTLIFPVALSLSSLAPGIVCHQASRVSHYYSVLFPQKNASSAISFLLKICGPSPPPAQLPTTPCRPGSEDWILNISSDPFHSPVSRCPVVSVSCYLLSQSLSQDNRKRKVWTDFLLAD